MPPFDNHFWMLIILCFVPIAVHIIKKPTFFNSSLSNGILLAITITALKLLETDNSGAISTCLFVIFLILPLYSQKKLCESILNLKTKRAKYWLKILKISCPAFPGKELVKLLSTLDNPALLNKEELQNKDPKTIPALIACIQLHFLQTDWQSSSLWLKNFSEKNLKEVPWLTILHLRVLCETNKFEEAVEFTKSVRQSQSQYLYFIFHMIYLAAYFGNKRLLDRLFELPVQNLKDENKEFWRALCLYKNESTAEQGEKLLGELCDSESDRISRSSKAALQNNVRLEDETLKASLTNLSDDLFENLEDYLGPQDKGRQCTHFFILANVLMYMLTRPEINPHFPYNNISEQLVLFLPESADSHEWWRLLSTTFLHGSFLHLLSNMFMLLIFGYMIEPYFKKLKMSFIYLGAGICGMVIVTLSHNPEIASITLGASGSTMSLMGAYIAVLLKQNSRSSVKLRKQQLIFLFVLILIQSRLDLISPQISFTAHVSGLVFGLITAYILYKPLYADLEKRIESHN